MQNMKAWIPFLQTKVRLKLLSIRLKIIKNISLKGNNYILFLYFVLREKKIGSLDSLDFIPYYQNTYFIYNAKHLLRNIVLKKRSEEIIPNRRKRKRKRKDEILSRNCHTSFNKIYITRNNSLWPNSDLS